MSLKIEVKDYSEKAILVVGDTKVIRTGLKELGGKWNASLVGWIFSKTKRDAVAKLVSEYVKGERKLDSADVKTYTPASASRGCASASASTSASASRGGGFDEKKYVSFAVFSALLQRVERLEALLQEKKVMIPPSEVAEEDDDEELVVEKPVRLLHK
jgi:hypothetical protein